MGCGSTKERPDLQVDDIDDHKKQRTRVLAVKGAPAAGQSRYAAETAGGDSDGDSDDEAATAAQTRKGGGGGKKKKRRDEDDDEDDAGPPPQADSDMQRLMQQYKEQPKNNGRGSTLLAANKHAQAAKRAEGHTSPLQQQGGGNASVVALRPPPKKRVNLATLLKDSDTDDVGGGEDEGAEAEGAGATLPAAFSHPRRALSAQHGQGSPAPLRQRWSNNEEQPPFSDPSDADVHGEFEGGEGEGQLLHGAYNEDVEALEAGPAFQLQPRKKEQLHNQQKDQSLRELPVIQPATSLERTKSFKPPVMGLHRSPSLHGAAAAAADEGGMMSMPGQIDSNSGDEDCDAEGEGGVGSSQDLDGQTPVHGRGHGNGHGAPGAGNKGFAKPLAGGGGGGGSLFVSHHSANHSQSTTHMLDEGTGTSVFPTRNNSQHFSTNQRSPHNHNQNQLSPLNHNIPQHQQHQQFQTHSPLANGHAFNNQHNQGRTMAAASGEDEFAF